MSDYVSILPTCVEIVLQAGDIIRDAWYRPHDLTHKGVTDLVTETDFAVQAMLRTHLCALLPEAAFIGEEDDGEKPTDASLCWVVDPVDGTTNFVHGIPVTATSVALCENGLPILGVVNAPMLGEFFHAAKGHGAFLNENKIEVSRTGRLIDSVVATGFPYDTRPELQTILGRLEKVLPKTQGVRRLGSAALDLAWVACGRMDAYYEATLKPWDMAAGWLLVEEAGGKVTNLNGSPAALGAPLLASNGILQDKLLALLEVSA